MNVAREVARQLILPAAMILVGVLLGMGMIGETMTVALLGLLIIVTAFRLGRTSTEIWPRH